MKSNCVLLCFLLINSLKLVIGNENTLTTLLDCKNQVGATDEDVKMIVDKKMPTSRTGLCLLTCLYEHLGIIKDGKFVPEQINQIIGAGMTAGGSMAQQFVEEVTNDCKDIKNDDKCILAKDIIMCAAESMSIRLKENKEL